MAKGPLFHTGGAPSSSEQSKAVVATSGPKVTLLQQKKADTLEQLKETLRKKQEMLEQKRNGYRKKIGDARKTRYGCQGRGHMLQLVWVTRQSSRESNNNSNNNSNSLSVSCDHLISKSKCASNDPKPGDEVKTSSTEKLENTNVSEDNDSTLDKQETKESDNDNNKSNHESFRRSF
ncbi:PREDICTED: zinc finger CCCH domain-containing protein 41-like [Camelina sativa]|uniref:Zinc finger CCCH domain-containing protein 41-like n=1 Tax=Camelina sativa TaxID=90675 RepID=A0ABM1QG22_CAMSA|nr:PREDICTED: zinc finger CCCH domain-containing protein 41-like [Camelina sativa]